MDSPEKKVNQTLNEDDQTLNEADQKQPKSAKSKNFNLLDKEKQRTQTTRTQLEDFQSDPINDDFCVIWSSSIDNTVLRNGLEHEENKCRNYIQDGQLCVDNLASNLYSVKRKKSNNDDDNESSVDSDYESKINYISIQRNIIHHHELNNKSIKLPLRKRISTLCAKWCKCNPATFIFSIFPLLYWLPRYPFKEYILSDIMTGFILAILQVPQGMAYALLARVEPVYGLYVSFFPVLVYFVMGTCRHVSIGTFSVISLMISNTLAKFDEEYKMKLILSDNVIHNGTLDGIPSNIDVAISLGLVVGLWQFAFGILKLGMLTFILSDQLISGFTCGGAIHVGTSQVKELFDIKVGIHTGQFQLIKTYIDIFKNLKYTNLITLSISAVSLFTLAVVKDHINDRFQHKMIMPLPIDLVVVIIGTLASHYGNFETNYNVSVVREIPRGLPGPSVPKLQFIPDLIIDGLIIGIIIYAITYSMGKIFARKHKYEIDATQEFLALGTANIFSSFFSCYPCSNSLSRCVLQEKTGGKTQLTNLIASSLIVLVLFFLAPLLYSLPRSILGSIIIVALKGLFVQTKDFYTAWKTSRIEAMVWLVTFLSVVLLSIDVGLLIGVFFSIASVLITIMVPKLTILGNVPNTEIYLDIERYEECKELDNIRIYHFGGGLCFLNREPFKNSLMESVSKRLRNKINEKSSSSEIHQNLTYVILDCSSISILDSNAAHTLKQIKIELKENGIMFILARYPVFVDKILKKIKFFEDIDYPCVFPSVHDAVVYCQNNYIIRL